VAYFHILATNIDEAIQIAKDNPEFAYIPSATIEVRPIKTKEIETGFIYPTKKNVITNKNNEPLILVLC